MDPERDRVFVGAHVRERFTDGSVLCLVWTPCSSERRVLHMESLAVSSVASTGRVDCIGRACSASMASWGTRFCHVRLLRWAPEPHFEASSIVPWPGSDKVFAGEG